MVEQIGHDSFLLWLMCKRTAGQGRPHQLTHLCPLAVQKEIAFRACDAATRKRRVLVKMISCVDLSGAQFGNSEFRALLC